MSENQDFENGTEAGENAAEQNAFEVHAEDCDGDDIEILRSKLEEAEQNALRAHAELDNYRKRTQRAAEEDRKYAALPLMRELLPVVDNLSRALSAADDESGTEGIVQGVQMVVSQLEAVLAQQGCERIEALGKPFDPMLHEAVGQQPHEEIPANHVSLELQTGYRLHDRVVRPAQVYVSTGPATAS